MVRRAGTDFHIQKGLKTFSAMLCLLPLTSGCVIVDRSQSSYAHVPPGHLPPPGKCRVWFPDRPPGHQPPPGDCDVLRFQVPTWGFLL
jgi:hypothetical protein